ncbi:MAG: YggS family pyridoxal phosphate-dependent enzyme [Acidimicrobiia bacterium]
MSYQEVTARIEAAAQEAGRPASDIALIVVSKGRPAAAIQSLYDAGHRDFGENRAQELAAKAPELPSDIRWHFVGPLQRNKVGLVRPLVERLHSLDSLRLAAAWVRGDEAAPPALLEINLANEPQKHGFGVDEASSAVDEIIGLGVDLRGVMAIPPHGEPASPYFRQLVDLRDRMAVNHPALTEVSAGMTDDFEDAIRQGATTIRVGRAIFE